MQNVDIKKKRVEMWADGAGYNGYMSRYAVVCEDQEPFVAETAANLTNNQAEYYALLTAIEMAPDDAMVTIYLDSLLVVNQVNKKYQCHSKNLTSLLGAALARINNRISVVWVPREKNKAGKILEKKVKDFSKCNGVECKAKRICAVFDPGAGIKKCLPMRFESFINASGNNVICDIDNEIMFFGTYQIKYSLRSADNKKAIRNAIMRTIVNWLNAFRLTRQKNDAIFNAIDKAIENNSDGVFFVNISKIESILKKGKKNEKK